MTTIVAVQLPSAFAQAGNPHGQLFKPFQNAPPVQLTPSTGDPHSAIAPTGNPHLCIDTSGKGAKVGQC